MKYNIKYEKRCLKYLKRFDKNTQLRIIKAINQLPFGDIKRLQANTENFRLRVGDFRIIFNKDDKNLIILKGTNFKGESSTYDRFTYSEDMIKANVHGSQEYDVCIDMVEEKVAKIVTNWQSIYRNRPAMMDELKKI